MIFEITLIGLGLLLIAINVPKSKPKKKEEPMREWFTRDWTDKIWGE